eukprot:g70259.t1
MAEPIEGEFVLWLTLRMYSKTVKANPRYFFTIQRAVFEERVHVGYITMFEETEATQATGHKGFRVMLFLGDDWAHYMINKSGGSELRQLFYPGFVLKASPYSYVVGPPVKGVGREGMIIKLQLGWQDKLLGKMNKNPLVEL